MQFFRATVGLIERTIKSHLGGKIMLHRVRLVVAGVLLVVGSGAYAQSNEIATGNMHFDAKDMDANGDHMITREEMVAYAEKQWDMMAQGKDTLPISVAAKDFATGGVNFNARTIDADHDGTVSKAEFVAFAGKKFDTMKKTDNMVSVADMARSIARGNTMSSH
jgi:hypothetical protein